VKSEKAWRRKTGNLGMQPALSKAFHPSALVPPIKNRNGLNEKEPQVLRLDLASNKFFSSLMGKLNGCETPDA